MSQTEKNVTAAKPNTGGAISVAASGTTPPTDATTALAEAFKSLGYISEDGLTQGNLFAPETIKAWGGDVVLTLNNDSNPTSQFTLIEIMNTDVLKFVFGEDNVTGTLAEGIEITVNDDGREEKVMAIDMVLKEGALKRVVIPRALITEISEVSYTDSDAVGYQVTVQANRDSDGNYSYEYIKKPATNG